MVKKFKSKERVFDTNNNENSCITIFNHGYFLDAITLQFWRAQLCKITQLVFRMAGAHQLAGVANRPSGADVFTVV